MVLAAGGNDSPSVRNALEDLCQTYWYPLYAYSRGKGISPELSEDLVQGFFAQLFRLKSLKRVDRERGRFRSFLLASFNHFIADEYAREKAQKRGGDISTFSIDALSAEERYALEPVEILTPEDLYERRWAMTLLEETLGELERYYKKEGKVDFFAVCKDTLYGTGVGLSYAALGGKLGISESAIKMAVMRMRRRYRSTLISKVHDTVGNPEEVDDELSHLMQAVSK